MEIQKYLQEFETTFMPDGFKWRKGQKEAIEEIIQTYLEGKYKVVILDAPVGSGKSLIGMTVSWILNQLNKKGYILTSDIALQDQYESDFEKFNLSWGSVKGVDNYTCIDNLEKHSLGTCKIRNINSAKMYCYNECPYFVARNKAKNSQTSLLNYAYWLIMMNYVNQHSDVEIFSPRDFTICDEAHKILDIVQNNYSPKFNKKIIEKLERLTNFFKTYKVDNLFKEYYFLQEDINQLWKEENQETLYNLLIKIKQKLQQYRGPIKLLKDRVKKDYPSKKPPKEWKEAFWISEWINDFILKLEDYIDIIEKTSIRNIIKNPNGEDIIFNCLEENYLMKKYFHQWTGFTVLMSATFSDPTEYLKNISLTNAKYIKTESLFDYSKSPIYYYNKRKMSYNYISQNLSWLCKTIDNIIEKHQGENGLIHSASYDLAMKIYKGISPKSRRRILIYNGTEEKRKNLDLLKEGKGKVILGPSLLEGLDLKNDWSRFAIFAKVPYLSLADRFVNVKMKINPGWYKWRSILNILQGTGRSVRNESDWAITYILDSCLGDLIHSNRKAFPEEFTKRIVVISE